MKTLTQFFKQFTSLISMFSWRSSLPCLSKKKICRLWSQGGLACPADWIIFLWHSLCMHIIGSFLMTQIPLWSWRQHTWAPMKPYANSLTEAFEPHSHLPYPWRRCLRPGGPLYLKTMLYPLSGLPTPHFGLICPFQNFNYFLIRLSGRPGALRLLTIFVII